MEIIYTHGDIRDFILRLDSKTASRVDQVVKRLEKCGNELRMPHSKSVGGGLFELRIKGTNQIRIIYVFHDNQALLLHIFFKKRWSIRRVDIEYARNILKQYLA